MIRQYLVVLVLFVLSGCAPQKTEERGSIRGTSRSQGTTADAASFPVPRYHGAVAVEIGGTHPNIAGYNDTDVVARIPIEYAPESDAVTNYRELDPSEKVSALLDHPFVGLEFRTVAVDDEDAFYHTLGDALKKLGIPITESQEATAQSADLHDTIDVVTPDISIELLKVTEDLYQIVFVEVPAAGTFFRSSLPTDLTPEQVVARLGEPNFKKKDDSV